jgi:hypothetical protein
VALLSICILAALLAALAVHVAGLRARVLRHERTLATVQQWAAQELRALRGEFTVARVNASAAGIMTQRAEKRVAIIPPSEGEEDDPEEQRDTLAMAAPGTPAPKPADEEGEATTFFAMEPPMYAARSSLMRPPAPLDDPDLIGSEDIADEVARSNLGPDDKTPPRRGRTAMLVPVYRDSVQGDVA